jgi:adenosylcobinamide kinase/adenosylcobinamide-phosphate guanylyltransferase
MASRLCLILGGVRSGKSAFAEKLVRGIGGPTLYVATGLPTDHEMEERIRRHRESRPAQWTTLEEPLDLSGQLRTAMTRRDPPGVVLIDSLDMWVGNVLLGHEDEDAAAVESAALDGVDRLLGVIGGTSASYFLVSGEVGLSLVPPAPLGRRFQDLLGLVNQRVAAAADRVYLVVAGIPTEIKGSGQPRNE